MSMRHDSIHPAVHVTAGFFLILLIQYLRGGVLLVAVFPLLAIAFSLAAARCWLLVKRMRYIFLALMLLFAWQTPGVLIFPALGVFSPSNEGVLLAGEQLLRLAGAAAVVAGLLQLLDAAAWMNGLHAVLRPLQKIGFSPDRFILRLRLVMDQIAGSRLNWRDVLNELEREMPVTELTWEELPLSGLDRFLIVSVVLVFLGVVWWQG